MTQNASVTELWIYPVKSLPGVAVPSLAFDPAGPVGDRRWMLVDEKGRFVSQRGTPGLALFRVELGEDGVRVTAPDGDAIRLPEGADAGSGRTVTIWKDTVPAWEVSTELSDWFAAKLDRGVRLVFTGTISPRRIPDTATDDSERVGFADGYPLLVCSQASLDRLNRDAGLALDSRRFRPNVVVAGLPADVELELGALRFERGRIDLLKTCARCNIPAIDLQTAVYDKQVAAAIKTHCQWQGATVFGVNGVARGLGTLRTGDQARLESPVL